MLVGVLGTWPVTVGIGEEKEQWKRGEQSMRERFEGNIKQIGHLKEVKNLEALN